MLAERVEYISEGWAGKMGGRRDRRERGREEGNYENWFEPPVSHADSSLWSSHFKNSAPLLVTNLSSASSVCGQQLPPPGAWRCDVSLGEWDEPQPSHCKSQAAAGLPRETAGETGMQTLPSVKPTCPVFRETKPASHLGR